MIMNCQDRRVKRLSFLVLNNLGWPYRKIAGAFGVSTGYVGQVVMMYRKDAQRLKRAQNLAGLHF